MKAADLYKLLSATLSESDARYVLSKRCSLSHADLISNPDLEVEEGAALKDLQAYKAGTPLSRIYGEREFWGMAFEINEATLDPRIDTEVLVEAVLERYKNKPPETILDLGTGTGCILIALLKVFPQAKGVGIDLSERAVEAAQSNAERHGVASRAQFHVGNWAESIRESFDVVVSNPPYIVKNEIETLDESVQNYDPIQALDGGDDGLEAYKKIFSQLFHILKPCGSAFFEIGFDQSDSVTRLSRESRFSIPNTYLDSAGYIRVLEVCHNDLSGDKSKK